MENRHPDHMPDIKWPTDPLDCDAGRELSIDMVAERAIVAGLLHHLLQYGIGVCDIPNFTDPDYTADRCVMEWIFRGCTGEAELVVKDDVWLLRGGSEPPVTGKVLLDVGAGANILKGWKLTHPEFHEFEKAMRDFEPDEFCDADRIAARAAAHAQRIAPVEASPQATDIPGLIQALNESASAEGCPEGRIFVDSIALGNLVQAVGVGSAS